MRPEDTAMAGGDDQPSRSEDFKDMVRYFWTEKGDPERFTGWDEAYCEKVWPAFLYAWKQHKATEQILDALCRA